MTHTPDTDGAVPIIQYWNQAEPPAQIVELAGTFARRNPGMIHLLFNETTAAELIAERLGDRHGAAFADCAVPAMQADYFRYCAVYALGGIYADANFCCSQELSHLLDDEGHLFEQRANGVVLNGLFAFRSPGHPLLAMTIEVATRNIENRISEAVGLTTGPAIFSGLTQLARGGPLEDLRESAGRRLQSHIDISWNALADSLESVAEEQGPVEKAFNGVRISSRPEMLKLVEKPGRQFKSPERHHAHWEGTIYRTAGGRAPR